MKHHLIHRCALASHSVYFGLVHIEANGFYSWAALACLVVMAVAAAFDEEI